jgi:protein-tyrosine-phosphatase
MPTKPHKLLLLCTGNTCRSQMAHAMAQQWSQLHGDRVALESRGIRANAGDATTEEALIVLVAANINWLGTSQRLSIADLDWADDVWGMTQEHIEFAQALGTDLSPHSQPRYQLLAVERELADPLGSGIEAYQDLFVTLQELIPKRLSAI